MMADGSYYEGEFKDGEIDGYGFRKWQHNGNCYSGEFCKLVSILSVPRELKICFTFF